MDVFAIRQQLIADYAEYVQSFIRISDVRIREKVAQEIHDGLLWPDPLIQLNPAFEPGAWIDDLVKSGTLHPQCREIFRIKKPNDPSKPLRLHKHQTEAITAAQSGDNYVLTTGTGSGKSLAYIVPIVDYCLRYPVVGPDRRIRAIVVYPMNALANSQMNELGKFLCQGSPQGKPPVTFERYTGQESDEKKQEIIANPPDILLTNYVMLELLLTRPHEHNIVAAARGLKFLVLDELHTYRGRQGADVALLVRRVREATDSPSMQCVGTSATLTTGGSTADQQYAIADVASRLFGGPMKPDRVIGETLRRITVEHDAKDAEYVAELTWRVADTASKPPAGWDAFVADPLSSWIETSFGLTHETGTGQLRRARPVGITGSDGVARRLAALTRLPEPECVAAIQGGLLAGYDVQHPETQFPAFAFRLHQFISRGDTVYASLESLDIRHVTVQGQQFVPGDRSRVLLPLVFCRECGQEYYVVGRRTDRETGEISYVPRELVDQGGEEDEESGFLYANPAYPWPEEMAEVVERLPEDWLEVTAKGPKLKSHLRKRLPLQVRVTPAGQESPAGSGYWFMHTPFRFCLACGVAYGGRERSDYGKLASLSSEGRSTATTILSLSIVRALRGSKLLRPEARKLLSFTDNRQDASLQAGHFNDFVEVTLLRGALYRAVAAAGPEGLPHDAMPQKVFDALGLELEQYAFNPGVKYKQLHDTQRALRDVLAYRVYRDLRRGWRVTAPNLEQCGLLEIRYASLEELCEAEEEWKDLHPAMAGATPAERIKMAKVLLDFLRRELAVKVDYLDPLAQERIQQSSSQHLIDPWAIDENEQMQHATIAFPRSEQPGDYGGNVYVSGRSAFGFYLRRAGTLPSYGHKLSTDDAEQIISDFLTALRVAGLADVVVKAANGSPPGYQVPASAFTWIAGDGTQPFHDPLRCPRRPSEGGHVNPFFVTFYREVACDLKGIEAREHTAQVPNKVRQEREERFREAKLPVLYCSPTMELGVDIAQLNAVNLRNVPPTPANYAQRSGRAGRSGQPALVFSYCTTGSPHDQYFFKRPDRMVAGAVAPPRLDLTNEDLIRAHVHAVWLAETGASLRHSLKDVLDLSIVGGLPSLQLLPSIQAQITSPHVRHRAVERFSRILDTLSEEMERSDWYSDEWLEKTLAHAPQAFDRACERWRALYRAAWQQREVQHGVIQDASRSHQDKQQAKRLRAEAESQLELLTGEDEAAVYQSDFYSYRYFASEGFLPGYNFPRLPLSAYIPGRQTRKGQDEFLSRPRFLAISEFGPRSIIYHEGSRYVIAKVILPVGDESGQAASERPLVTASAKLCPHCGYLHPVEDGRTDPNLCEHCQQLLDHPLTMLFRMQNVVAQRRERINSDEEERIRMGYEIKTAVRFPERIDRPGYRVAVAKVLAGDKPGAPLLRLTYGDAATLWRINLGWRRRRPDSLPGFLLDVERGYWAKNPQADEEQVDVPLGPRTMQVIPFVEDRRNCLLIEPAGPLAAEVMASLQPALKHAIQIRYHLEDDELAAEPLPSAEHRRTILIYESAEGGAGALRQLLDDPAALGMVAREALALCHYDPETGEDLRRAPGSREDCEAACYDCLMSYINQTDHRLLDRRLVRDLLWDLAHHGIVESSPVGADRAEHLQQLKALCDSDLEREWLDYVEERRLRLPDTAQVLIEACHTRVDFLYREQRVAVYVDGPQHDFPDVTAKDHKADECLEDQGITSVRFTYRKETWGALCDRYGYCFMTSATASDTA